MNVKQLLKRKQVVASAGLVVFALVIGLAGLLLAVLPQESKANELSQEIAAAQTRLLSLQAGGSRGPAIKAADLFQLARAMPQSPDMPGILVDLAHAAGDSGVSIVNVTPGAALPQADGSTALPLKLVVDGSWSDISDFLRTLRDEVQATEKKLVVNGRLFVIDSVSITTVNNAGGLEASLQANAFTYGVPVPVVATTGTGTTSTTTTTTPAPGTAQAAGTTGG